VARARLSLVAIGVGRWQLRAEVAPLDLIGARALSGRPKAKRAPLSLNPLNSRRSELRD